MKYKIIFKNLRANLKNVIIFFNGNALGVVEFLVFWGIYSAVRTGMQGNLNTMIFFYDIVISVGIITIYSVILMTYSMVNYIRLRIQDYSVFVLLGMHKRLMYAMVVLEYFLGWLCSLLIGLAVGTGVLRGIFFLWRKCYPNYFTVLKVSVMPYQRTCKISFCIMAIVMCAIIVWANGKNPSDMVKGNGVKEKRPQSLYWILFVVLGIGMIAFGCFQYLQKIEWPYVYAHIEGALGAFLILVFAGGIILEWIYRRKKFYLKHMLQLNRLYNKYQSNMLMILILFSVHFMALTYCVAGIADLLPIGGYEKDFPYEAVWMSRETEEDRTFASELARKYNGAVKSIPMVRVTGLAQCENIGISEETYEKMTGKSVTLSGKEDLYGVSQPNSYFGKKVTSKLYEEWATWLVVGRCTEELAYFSFPSTDPEHLHRTRSYFTQNWFGKYSLDWTGEDVVVFPNKYFQDQRNLMLQKSDEATVLNLFNFPAEQREEALSELKQYFNKNGISVSEYTAQPYLYITQEFVQTMERSNLFLVTNKFFVMAALLLSALGAILIKILPEVNDYRRRYDFLDQMGIRIKQKRKTLSIEIQSISTIAALTAAALSAPYLGLYILRGNTMGIIYDKKIWFYWAILVVAYLAIEYFMQRVVVLYVSRKVCTEDVE